MDGLWWKTRLKLMIRGVPLFLETPIWNHQPVNNMMCLFIEVLQPGIILVLKLRHPGWVFAYLPPQKKGFYEKTSIFWGFQKMNLQKSTVDLWKWQYIIYPPFSNLHHSQVQLLCSGISFILGRFGHAVSSTYFGVCWLELHSVVTFGVTDRGRTGGLFRSSGTIFFALPFWFSAWWFFNQPKFEKY